MTKLTSAEIERFYAFIDESREPGALAALSKLDILSVPRLVPHIFIVEFRRDGGHQLFVKFSGTEVDRIFGANVQGSYLEDFDLSHDSNASARFLDIVSNKTEEYVRRTQEDEVHGTQVYERLVFPLSEDQERVDALIGFMAVSVADSLEEGGEEDVRIDQDIKKLLGGPKAALVVYLPPQRHRPSRLTAKT